MARHDSPVSAVLFTDSDVFAGTERHMLDLARGLRSEGAAAAIACPMASPLADRAREENIEVISIEKGGFLDWAAIRTLRQKLRSAEVNLIHAHNGRTALSAALAVKLEGRGAYVLTQHFLVPSRSGRRGIKALLSNSVHRWISRNAGHIIAISEAARRGIEARGEAVNGNVTTIPNGIPSPDARNLASPEAIRAGLGVGPDQALIVCAARLEQEKDVRSLIAAMPAVLTAAPDAICVAAGEGSQRGALASQIDSLGLRNSVRLAGFCEDAMSLINAADLFVLPSLAEPFGLVLIEAMSLGKPVIATNAGGPREIVEDGLTGLLVPPAEPIALAAAITRLIRDPSLRIEMGLRGRQRFTQNYTVARMSADILRIYHDALRGRRAPERGASRSRSGDPLFPPLEPSAPIHDPGNR
jgi:glycosyltransferase involved in cell wall biosynthesis